MISADMFMTILAAIIVLLMIFLIGRLEGRVIEIERRLRLSKPAKTPQDWARTQAAIDREVYGLNDEGCESCALYQKECTGTLLLLGCDEYQEKAPDEHQNSN